VKRLVARAVINQAFARQFFNQRNALGLHITEVEDDGSRRSCEIVGVASDTHTQNLRGVVEPRYFFTAHSGRLRFSSVHARQRRADRRTASGGLPDRWRASKSSRRRRCHEQMAPLTAQDRATARLALVFGIVALWLAAMGSTASSLTAISRRRSEIAIRIALGAPPQAGFVANDSQGKRASSSHSDCWPADSLAYAGARLLASRLYGVSPEDFLTTTLAIGVLVVRGAVRVVHTGGACIKTDPLAALR
jgi:hypothetical protein